MVSVSDDPYGTAIERALPSNLDEGAVLRLDPTNAAPPEGDGVFDAVICRDVLRVSPNPLGLLARLWQRVTPGGVLLLDAKVLPGIEDSVYARFTPAAGWVPGALALRWMVEVCGFDVEDWIDLPDAGEESRAALRATRSARQPARSAP